MFEDQFLKAVDRGELGLAVARGELVSFTRCGHQKRKEGSFFYT
jgi:hypothetical protein